MLKSYNLVNAVSKKAFSVSVVAATLSLTTVGAALAQPCEGPGAPTTTETQCLTAVQIPGNALRSFDISWVNPNRSEYYLGDRSNAGIEVILPRRTRGRAD